MTAPAEPADPADPWVDRLRASGPRSVDELFTAYRPRLLRLVQLRMDPQLSGRLDPSDVLQKVFLDVAAGAAEYAARPDLPVYLWLRLMTAQRLAALHRRHLTATKRDAAPPVSTESLAAKLLGRGTFAGRRPQRTPRPVGDPTRRPRPHHFNSGFRLCRFNSAAVLSRRPR